MNKVVLLFLVVLFPVLAVSQETAKPLPVGTPVIGPGKVRLPEAFTKAGLDQTSGSKLFAQATKLLASDGTASDCFGLSVVISGDTAAVSTDFNDGPASSDPGTGEVFVFVRSGTDWTLQQRLKASDGGKEDKFGAAMALEGDTLVVGAWGNFIFRGKAYVFQRSGGVWTQVAMLNAPDGNTSDRFGSSVAISGNTVVVGAWFGSGITAARAGAAYTFERFGAVWVQQQKLVAPEGVVFDAFGTSVAIAGDELYVTCPGCDFSPERPNVGSLSVFTRTNNLWTRQQVLTGSDSVVFDNFGHSVAVSGTTLVVGASDADVGSNGAQGKVYVFARSGSTWVEQQKLTASNGMTNSTFGYDVAIEGGTIVVGAPSTLYTPNTEGWVYAFSRNGSTWTEQGMVGDEHGLNGLGTSVAISGSFIIGGAPYADVNNIDRQGLAFIFGRPTVNVTIGGRVIGPNGRGVQNTPVTMTDANSQVRYATTNSQGYYRFVGVQTNATYTFRVAAKHYQTYGTQTVAITGELTSLDFVPLP